MPERTMFTLNSGEAVWEDEPEAIEQAGARRLHVACMLRLRSKEERADYLRAVRRDEGAIAATLLRAAYIEAWEKAKHIEPGTSRWAKAIAPQAGAHR